MRAVLVGLAVLLVGAVGLVVWRSVEPRPSGSRGVLSINSTPTGAQVVVGETVLGQTPYFADNTFPPGPHEAVISLKGFRTERLAFDGRFEAKLDVTLRRLVTKRVEAPADSGAPVVEIEVVDVEIDPEARRHTKGPLRPPEPKEFVDEDLDKEAATK